MYQTLYRKYRPNDFSEVVGQEVIVKTLKNAITKNKLNHAYLFTGPRGTGKTSIAKILAKTINCESLNDCIPCNRCVSCTQINNKQTIDIIEIDAASNNGVDEIREIRNKVNLVPSVGKYKVYIIDEVHMLTTGAFNALLKTLEEPPKHIIFILATTEPHKIPATILSRCQRFDFKKINSEKMVKKLSSISKLENIDITDDVLYEISRLSDGCMRDALSILDQVISYSDENITIEDVHEINGTVSQNQLKDFILSLIDNNYDEVFNMIDNYDKNGKNFIKLSEEIILFLRNILIEINAPKYFENNLTEDNIYKDISQKFSGDKIIKYLKIFNESISLMKKANNTKIIFELCVVELMNQNNFSELTNKLTTKTTNINVEPVQIKKETKEEPIKPKNIDKKEKKIPKQENDFIKKIKNIRVNNCLCYFNKKQLLDLKQHIDELRMLIIDPNYTEIASMVVDGSIRAVGENYIIFVFNSDRDSDNFNENVLKIDSMLSEHFKKEYKTIAVDSAEWEQIKKEFNSKTKKYQYMEEPTIESPNAKPNELENLFENIIEYQ